MNRIQKNVVAGLILASILGSSTIAYASSGDLDTLFSSLGITKQKVRTLAEKEKNGDTLTQEESTLLQTLKSKMPKRGEKDREFSVMGMGPRPMMEDLTDAEKTALESMTEEQKHDFFDKKRDEMESKMEARENVIDKKLNDETLTDEEKTLLEEIKTQRAQMKAKRVEQKAAFDAVKPILEKKKNGETLSDDEQKKLDDFEAKYPRPGKGEKRGKGFGRHMEK